MRELTISKNLSCLRKKKNITQEQLATALNISPQAVSKWETDTCLPDALMLPLIADYFNVSIDYLFYGEDITYDDIYEKNFQRIAALEQMTGFEEALRMYAPIHHGISRGNIRSNDTMLQNYPTHLSGECGLSLLNGKGYAALVTRRYFENINQDTADFAEKLLLLLSKDNCIKIIMAVISMSDISYNEMKELLKLNDDNLRCGIDHLISADILIETKSKHKSLGMTYQINNMYHTCLCILIATLEMQRESLNGISCCMGYGDYPISL